MAEKQMDLREAVEKCQRMRAVVDAARAWVEYVRFGGYAKGMRPESAAGELLAAVDALAAHEQPTDSPAAPGAPSAPRREKGSCDGGQPGRIRPAGPTSKPQPMDGLQKAVQRARALMSYSEPEVGAYGPLPDKVEEADEILREVEAALSAPSPSSATLRQAVLRVVRCKRQTADDSCLLVPMADVDALRAALSVPAPEPEVVCPVCRGNPKPRPASELGFVTLTCARCCGKGTVKPEPAPAAPEAEGEGVREVTLSKEVERIINRFSGENGSNTPDFILAQFLVNALAAFDAATNRRTEWYQPPDPRPSPDSPGLSVPGLYEAGSAITTELAAIGASAGEIQRLPAVLRIMTRHMTAAAEPAPAEPAPDEPEEVCRKCGWWLSAANRCGKHGGAANATCHCKDWVLRSVLGEDHGREPTLPKRQAKARYTPGPAERRVLEGEPAPDEPDPCPTCHDREYVETADPDGQSRVLGAEECPECGITGRHPCEGRVPPPEQHGTGRAGGGKGAE